MCTGCKALFSDWLWVLQYILNDKEVQVKTELWMKQNAEYLKEQKGRDHLQHQYSSTLINANHVCVDREGGEDKQREGAGHLQGEGK